MGTPTKKVRKKHDIKFHKVSRKMRIRFGEDLSKFEN
jgi:hypothetical protein